MDAHTLYGMLSEAWEQGVIESAPRSYSGRAMYGSRCIGITVGATDDIIKLGFWAGQTYGKEFGAEDFISGVASDQMGRGLIVYWRTCAWDGTMEERD